MRGISNSLPPQCHGQLVCRLILPLDRENVVEKHSEEPSLLTLNAVGVFRQFYGDLYTSSDFHHRQGSGYNQFGNCQIQGIDFSSCEDCVQQCDLGSLADLDTSSTDVQVGTFQLHTVRSNRCLYYKYSYLCSCTTVGC